MREQERQPVLQMRESEFEAIRRHGEETYPLECCGVMLGAVNGEVNVVEAAVRTANARTEAAHNRYAIEPLELVRIQREARGQGMEIVGFYHSHPDCAAMWSSTDLAEAHWTGCSYVITAVNAGKAAATNSFRLMGASEELKRFEAEAVKRM